MSLGLCLCQGAGQRVPTMCSGVGCECSNASPFLCCCVPSSIQKHWKTAQPLCNTPDSAVQPHLHELCCWCPPARHAACPSRRLPRAAQSPHPQSRRSPGDCAGSGHAHSPQRGRTQRSSSCPVKLQAGAGSCDAVLGSKAKTQAGSHA